MPGGVGGEAPRGAPLSRLTAIRVAKAQLAVPSGEVLPTNIPSTTHSFRRGTKFCNSLRRMGRLVKMYRP